MRSGRTAVALVAAGALLVGVAAPASAHDADHGRRDARHFFERDKERWDRHDGRHDGRHEWRKGHEPAFDAGPTVIARGLNNPRQLSLPLDAALLIAEAGKGGTTCQGEGEEATCVGETGAVSVRFLPQRWGEFHTPRIVKNLLSASGPDGTFAVGSDGVSTRLGRPIFIQETFFPPDVLPEPLGGQAGFLLAARPFGEAQPFANISEVENTTDPDGMGPESNPYAVLALREKVLVADAAANTVFSVNRNGVVSVFHVFPNIVNDATTTATDEWPGYDPTPEFPGAHYVPTSLAEGPDGDIYVGGLASELPGQGIVTKLDRETGEVEQTWTGFSGVTGVAVGRDGSLYVSQLFGPQAAPVDPMIAGVLTKVSRHGTRTDKDVPFPHGVAVDAHDNVYVTAFSVAPDTGFPGSPEGVDTSGQVWRLRF
jgi:hypothetical protein